MVGIYNTRLHIPILKKGCNFPTCKKMAAHKKYLFHKRNQFNRELVNVRLDDEQPSTGRKDAPKLASRPALIKDVMQRVQHDDPVEGPGWEWETFRWGASSCQPLIRGAA